MNDCYHHPPSPFNNQYNPYGNYPPHNFNPQWNNGYHPPHQQFELGPNPICYNDKGHNWNGPNDMHYHHHNFHGHNNQGRGNHHGQHNDNHYKRSKNSYKKNKSWVVSKNSERQLSSGE